MERLKELEKDVRKLKAEVTELQRQVGILCEELKGRKHPVEELLRQCGFPVLSHGERSQQLLPPNVSLAQEERFYQFMRRYSFRLFARDLIQFPEGNSCTSLTRYCSLKTVRSYLKFLSELGVVRIHPDGSYQLIQRKCSGVTLNP